LHYAQERKSRSGACHHLFRNQARSASSKKPFSLGRLDVFSSASNRYIPLTDEALQLSAELWAKARQEGRPTADSKELDVDVILAAQVLSFGAPASDVVIATTNTKHLA